MYNLALEHCGHYGYLWQPVAESLSLDYPYISLFEKQNFDMSEKGLKVVVSL